MSVQGRVGDQSDDDADRWLTTKQFLVKVIMRSGEQLAHHASYGVLCGSAFKGLGVSQKDGRHQFHLANEHGCA